MNEEGGIIQFADVLTDTEFDELETENISRNHVAEIIEARVEEILDKVDSELRKVKRSGKCFGYFLKLSKSTIKIPMNINEDWYLNIKEMPRNIAANIIWCETNCFFVIK